MHASDRFPGKYDHSVIGEGSVNFDPIFACLADIGYHGFISLDVQRGNDLPLLWYRVATGAAVEPPRDVRHDVVWKHAVPHAVQRAVRLLRGDAQVAPPADEVVDVVHDPRDPLPTLPFVATMLRHPGGLIRPFLRVSEEQRDEARLALG